MPTKSPKKPRPLSWDSTEILIAEYNYIARTADQSNEDRSRISTFYLIAVGSLLAALSSAQFLSEVFDPTVVNLIFGILFFLLTFLGTTTILQLIRLRVAWFESILAMNNIKEFMITKDTELAGAFKWRIKTLPRIYKVNSIAFLQTLEVAVLSGLTLGTGVFFLQKSFQYDYARCNLAFTISSGILAFLFQLWNYKRQLTHEHKRLQKELGTNNVP